MFFSTQIKTFGLDISEQAIKIVQLDKGKNGLKLLTYNKVNLPEGLLQKGETKDEERLVRYIHKALNGCSPKIIDNYVVACLPEIKTFIKLVHLKDGEKKELNEQEFREIIKKELPNHIPLDPNEVYFDWQILEKKDGMLEVLIGVAPKKTVEWFSNILKKSGLVPVALEIEAQSIVRSLFPKEDYYLKKPNLLKEDGFEKILNIIKSQKFVNIKIKTDKDGEKEKIKKEPVPEKKSAIDSKKIYFIIDCGASRTGLIAWSKGIIKFTTNLDMMGCDLTKEIGVKLNLDDKKVQQLASIYGMKDKKNKTNLKKILSPFIDKICEEIIKAKDFYQTHFGNNEEKFEVVLTGGAINLKGLDEELSKKIGLGVFFANPATNLSLEQKTFIKPEEIQDYTTAIGLALRSFFIKDY